PRRTAAAGALAYSQARSSLMRGPYAIPRSAYRERTRVSRTRSRLPKSGVDRRRWQGRRRGIVGAIPRRSNAASVVETPPNLVTDFGFGTLDVLDGRGAAVAAGLVLDHDEPRVARHPAHPPLAGHVPPEGHHHAAVAPDDDVVPTCAGSHTVERLARACRDLDQRLAARRAPEPVALRVVVARVAPPRLGLPGQLAVRLLAQVLLDAHRKCA